MPQKIIRYNLRLSSELFKGIKEMAKKKSLTIEGYIISSIVINLESEE